MKRILLGVVVALGLACGVSAQVPGSPTGCARCGVISYLDAPTPEATVSAATFTLQGWGFECVSGKPADRVDVFYQDYNGFWRPLTAPALNYGGIAREDVREAYAGYCPTVALHTGWSLRVPNVPTGLRRFQINVWRGPYYEIHRRTYLIVP